MGVSYRFPMLDLGVVEAALRMPWWAYLGSGWDRLAFRLAIEPYVPQDVAWNMTKDEPALMAANVTKAEDWLPRRRGGPDDEEHRSVWRLIDATWEFAASPNWVPSGVVAKPHLAPARR